MSVMSADEGVEARLRSITRYLSFVLLVTSICDLFINRLVFRAGPDVLSHMETNTFYLALVGRISLTIEQFILFIVLALSTILLLREERYGSRVLGVLFSMMVFCSALLYAPLAGDHAWLISTILVLVTMVTVLGLAWLSISLHRGLSGRQRLSLILFLGCLVLSFIFPLYYRMYLLIGAVRASSLPLPLTAYMGGIFFVMATGVMVFIYALLAPSHNFTMDYRTFVKAAVLPTLIVVPLLYEMMRSFFVTQILSMVVAMSTDMVLDHDLLQLLVAVWWFFLTGVLLLVIKGYYSTNKVLQQEAVGLTLIMSTTFLFNYPSYLMLGIAGIFLISYSLYEE